ncbi:hypothetical protein LO772_10925 [Yinghuangia sp. ASG 101]|uniref:hypothetical protein n=1 Tax=Yinghuangia sp. ASG 101 TaxID=2896848 RepID=UPI001E659E2D|nr:hypothetical protein [Yinghuangia sp. ASG 101]UGQ14064.1 hypothetical protein LO772_10925 [Yinghuangia sp. ASG 101]
MSTIRTGPGRRGRAALAGAALLLGGTGLTLFAPAAHAGTVNPTVHCVLPAGQGEATGPQSTQVELTPENAAPGTQVHAVVTLGLGPATSTVSLNDVPTTPSIDLAMSGGATGTVTVTGPTVQLDTVSGQPVQIPTYEGDFIIPSTAQGVVDFTPVRNVTKTVVLGGTYTTNCDVVSGGGVVDSVNVQGPGSEQPTLTSPVGTVRPGYTLNFAGLGFPANAAPTATVCAAGGGACVTDPFTASSLTVSGLGELSGTATLRTDALPNGNYTVTVTAGGKQATTAVTVEAFVPTGPRTLSPHPTSGPLGTVVTLTGENWTANGPINIAALNSIGFPLLPVVNTQASPDGSLNATFTVTNADTTQIRIREGTSSTNLIVTPFTVTAAQATLAAAPSVSHRNGVVTLSGTGWPTGGTPAASLCDSAGNGCNAGALTGSTLAISANGTLSGTVTVGGGVAFGSYQVKVTSGGSSVTVPLTVQQRWITLTPDSGPLGTWTTIAGKDYANWAWIALHGVDANGVTTDDYSYAAADGAGNWLTWMRIQDPDTTAIVASETFAPGKKASAPFTITP